MSAENFTWLISAVACFLAGALLVGVINEKYNEQERFKAINDLRFKCVEMREMPLGACSRLFGEK